MVELGRALVVELGRSEVVGLLLTVGRALVLVVGLLLTVGRVLLIPLEVRAPVPVLPDVPL